MHYQLKDIIKQIDVTENGIFLVAREKEFEVITDYLNGLREEVYFEEEMLLLEKMNTFSSLMTFDEKWNFVENELGGNITEDNEFGWLALKNYTPNLVVKKDTGELYLAYLLDTPFQPLLKVGLQNVRDLIADWKDILRVFKRNH